MTPDEVLAVLAEFRRVQVEHGDALADPPVAFENTIADWDDAGLNEYFTTRWRGIAGCMNRLFEIDIPLAEWRAAIQPARSKTLRSLCELVSSHATVPVSMPMKFFGRECAEAGAFLTLRGMLQEAGADVSRLAPSTAISAAARTSLPYVFLPLIRQAPSVLRFCRPIYPSDAAHMAGGVFLGIASLVLGLLSFLIWWLVFPFVITLGAFSWVYRDSNRRQERPMEIWFDDSLVSFGDLARRTANTSGASVNG